MEFDYPQPYGLDIELSDFLSCSQICGIVRLENLESSSFLLIGNIHDLLQKVCHFSTSKQSFAYIV